MTYLRHEALTTARKGQLVTNEYNHVRHRLDLILPIAPQKGKTKTTSNKTQTPKATMPGRSHVQVPHLGGTNAAYQTGGTLEPNKPTLVMVNSFLTNSNLYGAQYANKELTDSMNLVAIELLGHGETRCDANNWTYWDTAMMNLQVIEALEKRGEIRGKVFVLGTSQGGWVTARMALLAPEKVRTCSFLFLASAFLLRLKYVQQKAVPPFFSRPQPIF